MKNSEKFTQRQAAIKAAKRNLLGVRAVRPRLTTQADLPRFDQLEGGARAAAKHAARQTLYDLENGVIAEEAVPVRLTPSQQSEAASRFAYLDKVSAGLSLDELRREFETALRAKDNVAIDFYIREGRRRMKSEEQPVMTEGDVSMPRASRGSTPSEVSYGLLIDRAEGTDGEKSQLSELRREALELRDLVSGKYQYDPARQTFEPAYKFESAGDASWTGTPGTHDGPHRDIGTTEVMGESFAVYRES